MPGVAGAVDAGVEGLEESSRLSTRERGRRNLHVQAIEKSHNKIRKNHAWGHTPHSLRPRNKRDETCRGGAEGAAGRSRRYLSLVDGDPVGAAEPPVVLDVGHAVLQVAESFRQIDLEQILQQIFQLVREVRREFDLDKEEIPGCREPTHLSADNLLVDLNRLVGEEGRIAGGHLVDQHTQGPPVDGLVVTLKASSVLSSFDYTLERMISGARYSGVPQSVHVRPLTRLAKPKSVIWNCLVCLPPKRGIPSSSRCCR